MNNKIYDSNFLYHLGQTIKSIRQDKGLSQESLAFKCDLHRTYIGSVERGERNITVLNLNKIAKALEVQITDLLEFSNE